MGRHDARRPCFLTSPLDGLSALPVGSRFKSPPERTNRNIVTVYRMKQTADHVDRRVRASVARQGAASLGRGFDHGAFAAGSPSSPEHPDVICEMSINR